MYFGGAGWESLQQKSFAEQLDEFLSDFRHIEDGSVLAVTVSVDDDVFNKIQTDGLIFFLGQLVNSSWCSDCNWDSVRCKESLLFGNFNVLGKQFDNDAFVAHRRNKFEQFYTSNSRRRYNENGWLFAIELLPVWDGGNEKRLESLGFTVFSTTSREGYF